jgi:hypothetical protein
LAVTHISQIQQGYTARYDFALLVLSADHQNYTLNLDNPIGQGS